MDIKKYQGVIPAFYACYDDAGSISPERTRALARHLLDKGVKGLYVGGSPGECIYHSVAERKVVLENVMAELGGKLTIIAHVACNITADSQELARHAEGLGVDAIAAIPPIYFHLPPYGIAGYWNDISAAAPSTDFIIYNIPQLAGVSLTPSLLAEMQKNPKVIGVKNSSMPTQDIQMWKDQGGSNFVVMNGPDEQLVSGLAIGATGGIGGTYAVMPELFLKIWELFYACLLYTSGEHIPAQLIGAEEVGQGGRLGHGAQVGGEGVVGGDQGRQDAGQEDNCEHHDTYDGQPVLHHFADCAAGFALTQPASLLGVPELVELPVQTGAPSCC